MDLYFINNYVTFICKNCKRKPFLSKNDFLQLNKLTLGNFCSKDCYTTYMIKNKDNIAITSRKSETDLRESNKLGKSLCTISK